MTAPRAGAAAPRPARGSRPACWVLALVVAMTALACAGDQAASESDIQGEDRAALDSRPASGAVPERFGVGRPASETDIATLDIDIMPDGTGLPAGRGTVAEGTGLYLARCAACHGEDLQGTPLGARLAPHPDYLMFPDGDVPTGARAIGNYWPYASTLFDYIRRAMPYDRPGSLTDDEVYAVTAYLLWENGILDQDAVVDSITLRAVVMPARDRFVADDRLGANRVR